MSTESFDSWAVVELMGHVRMAGRVTEEERFGCKMGRIDIPRGDGFFTQYFTGSSIYRMTPVSEEVARSVAAQNEPEPVRAWELPKPEPRVEPDVKAIRGRPNPWDGRSDAGDFGDDEDGAEETTY